MKVASYGITPVKISIIDPDAGTNDGTPPRPNIAMDELVNYLAKRKISCGLRDGNLRLAPHVYATRDDVDALVVAIKEGLKLS